MRLRTKILLLGIGTAFLAMILLGALMLDSQRNTYYDDVVIGSQGFARSLALEMVGDLASGRIDRLDHMVSQLAHESLGMVDIQAMAVMDHERRVLAHTNTSLYGAILSDPFVLEAARTDSMSMDESRVTSDDLLRIAQPIITAVPGHEGLRWGTLLLEVSLVRVHTELFNLLWRSLLIVISALIGFTALSYVMLTRLLIRPLKTITDTAREHAAGNLSARAKVSTRDELSALGNTINDMADRLQRYTSDLEERIRERTAELHRANQELNATMIKLREANEALSTQATTDGLTGLRNFRFFQQELQTEILLSRRLGTPLSLVMIDVDKFKLYNDRNGHPAGDAILREVASIIKRRIRATDISCRYGGEEFAVLLLHTGKVFAAAVAEQLRSRVEEFAFPDRERQPSGRLTISLGVATFPDDAQEAQALLKAADDALYRAKENGRNTIEVANGMVPGEGEA